MMIIITRDGIHGRGLEHSISGDELEDVARFLHKHLGRRAAAAAAPPRQQVQAGGGGAAGREL